MFCYFLVLLIIMESVHSSEDSCDLNENCKGVKDSVDKVTLVNGVEMPLIGLGTFKVESDSEVFDVLDSALEVGYRLIDTAVAYQNHK